MTQAIFFLIANCLMCAFIGFMVGQTFGYYKGIRTAGEIWEKSFTDFATMVIATFKKGYNNGDKPREAEPIRGENRKDH